MRKVVGSALLAGSCVASGCNSPGDAYAQGPWGPAYVRRDYPRYSTPWAAPIRLDTEEEVIADRGEHPIRPYDVQVKERWLRPDTIASRPSSLYPDPDPDPEPGPPFDRQPPVGQSEPGSGLGPEASRLAASPPAIDVPAISSPTRASSYAGTWKATDASGASCRIQLSSVPTLDLYKAHASGCPSAALQGVNAWSFGGDVVTLYARGKIVARLTGQEASLKGVMASSGSALNLSR